MSRKRFVIDTNVILNDPLSITRFGDNEVILPITVIEELDGFKNDQRVERAELARNARAASRLIAFDLNKHDVIKGIPINTQGGILRVDTNEIVDHSSLPKDVNLPLDYSKGDNRIINCAYINDATIVSMDTNLRIKASAYRILTEEYLYNKVDFDTLYTGTGELFVPGADIDRIYQTCFLDATKYDADYHPNKFFCLKDEADPKHSALVRYDAVMKELCLLVTDQKIMGLDARNMEQHFAFSALCDPDIKVVTLVGKAGCGKSLAAIAAGLHCVTQGERIYSKLIIYRPIVPMGNDIGYLPGSKEEKLGPWMQAIDDSIDFIMGDINAEDRPKIKKPRGSKTTQQTTKNDIPVLTEKGVAKISPSEELVQWGLLEKDALTYVRGRSIPNVYMIIDEGQNLTPHEMKTIITRCGEGTKIIITGDPSQIDSPYLDATNNGLTYVAERFKDQKIAAHITFTKSERSELAELAANIL